ncbi:hypothetical protein [Microvirga roseola]|uniref:hypothetical protein n=1 Tax=Microvirga roseola TaxID=2883126 RepID=UPI001E32B464|nr:hypothetical protein [Microvirga roseola]
MNDTSFQNYRSGRETPLPKMYSSDLQPLLQSLLSTLANIDFEYECEREKIGKSSPDINFKIRILERLKAQHRERREPYIRQLAVLQERILDFQSK